MTKNQRIVLAFFISNSDHKHNCFFSLKQISYECKLSVTTIKTIISFLESASFIESWPKTGCKTLFKIICQEDAAKKALRYDAAKSPKNLFKIWGV